MHGIVRVIIIIESHKIEAEISIFFLLFKTSITVDIYGEQL